MSYHYFRSFIAAVRYDLALWDMKIAFRFRDGLSYGGRALDQRHKPNHSVDMIIHIAKDQSEQYTRRIIAHELRHVWQHKHNLLTYEWSYGEWVTVWDGVPYPNALLDRLFYATHDGYKHLPFERDADEYADDVSRRWENDTCTR